MGRRNRMNDEMNLTQEGVENVEPTTEEMGGATEEVIEAPKTFTQEEVNEIVGRRVARTEAKIRKEYEELESVLKAGTGKSNVSEMAAGFREYYEQKGIKIPTEPSYSDRDTAVLAKAEAEDIIKSGLEEVVEETDRLMKIGVENMTAREKAVFKALAEYRQGAERNQELSKIGVTEDVYNSKEFKDFSAKFNSNTSVTEIYEMYNKMQPKKEIRTMGSMTNNASDDKGVKDFYTRDEAMKYTKEDFDKNPELFKAVERSMLKW